MSDEEMEERELDLTSPEVVTKYKSAAEIVNSYFFFLFFINSAGGFAVISIALRLFW